MAGAERTAATVPAPATAYQQLLGVGREEGRRWHWYTRETSFLLGSLILLGFSTHMQGDSLVCREMCLVATRPADFGGSEPTFRIEIKPIPQSRGFFGEHFLSHGISVFSLATLPPMYLNVATAYRTGAPKMRGEEEQSKMGTSAMEGTHALEFADLFVANGSRLLANLTPGMGRAQAPSHGYIPESTQSPVIACGLNRLRPHARRKHYQKVWIKTNALKKRKCSDEEKRPEPKALRIPRVCVCSDADGNVQVPISSLAPGAAHLEVVVTDNSPYVLAR